MNIKVIFYIYLIIAIIFSGYLYANKDISTIPDKTMENRNELYNKDIDILKYNISNYVAGGKNEKEISDFLSGLFGSPYIGIKENNVLFAYKKGSIEQKENFLSRLDSIFTKELSDKNIYSVVEPSYNVELFTKILNKKYNYNIQDNINIFNIDNKEEKLSIPEYELSEYFSDVDKVKQLKRNDTINNDIIIPDGTEFFLSNQIDKQTLLNLQYKGKEFKKGFDINDNSYPIVYINMYKKDGTGLLIKNFNNIKKDKIKNIFNNIDKYIQNDELIKELNEDKGKVESNQSIFDTTQIDDFDEYFDLYLEHKGYKVILKKNNTYLLENDNLFTLLHFDKSKTYNLDVSELEQSTYMYNFIIKNKVIAPAIVDKELFMELNKDLSNNGYELLEGFEYNGLGNNIIIN